MFPMFTLLSLILITLVAVFFTYHLVSLFLESQLDQFNATIQRIQTALVAEYRYNAKQWINE